MSYTAAILPSSQRSRDEYRYGLSGLALAFFILEMALIYGATLGYISLVQILFLHIALIIGLGVWVNQVRHQDKDLRFPILCWLFLAVLGPFGALLFLFCVFLYRRNLKTGGHDLEWLFNVNPDLKATNSETLFDRIQAGFEDIESKDFVASFRDIVILGNTDQKRTTLAKISHYYQPEFASILRQAVKDPSNAIRVQAATTLSKLELQYAQAIQTAQKQLADSPDNANALFKLANLTAEFVASKLIDERRQMQLSRLAIMYFERYLTFESNHYESQYKIGQLYLYLGQTNNAKHYLKQALATERNLHPEHVELYMSCLFELNEYDKLKAFSKENKTRLSMGSKGSLSILEQLEFWAEKN